MKEKEIKIFITLDSVKIQSINSMYKAGMKFYRSTSGVWLTDRVPFEFLNEIEGG